VIFRAWKVATASDPTPDLTVPLPPARPRTFERGLKHAFVDANSREWGVFDCVRVSGRLVIVGAGSIAAELRVFIAGDGAKRQYAFRLEEQRDLDAASLEQQLGASVPLVE
jgi:hypothetical protein